MGIIAKARAWFARKPALAVLNDAQIVQALSAYSLADIDALESRLLSAPQVDMPLVHHFAPGIYAREIIMPAGMFVIGHKHKNAEVNVCLSGTAKVIIDGKLQTLTGPCVFNSAAGTRKVLYVTREMRLMNIHPNPTNETEEKKLETLFIEKSPAFIAREKALEEMKHPTLNFQEAV